MSDKFFEWLLAAVIGLFVGILYVLRNIMKHPQKITGRMAFIFYGVGSTMIVNVLLFEISTFIWNDVPHTVLLACISGLSFLGIDTLREIALKMINKKLDLEEKKEYEKKQNGEV